jgi:hypothetical protein
MLRKKLVSLFIFSSFFSVNFINQSSQADIFGGLLNRIPGASQVNQAREAVAQAKPAPAQGNPSQTEPNYVDLRPWPEIYREANEKYKQCSATHGGMSEQCDTYLNEKSRAQGNLTPQQLEQLNLPNPYLQNPPPQKQSSTDGIIQNVASTNPKDIIAGSSGNDNLSEGKLYDDPDNFLGKEKQRVQAEMQKALGTPEMQKALGEARRVEELNKAADKAVKKIVADETPASIAAATQASSLPANKDYGGLSGGYKGNVPEGADITGASSSPSLNKGDKPVAGGAGQDSFASDSNKGKDTLGQPYEGRDNEFGQKDGDYKGAGENRQAINGDDNRLNSDYDTPDGVKRNSDGTVKYDTANKPGSDSGGSGKGRVVDGDWFPGSLNGSKGGANSASGGVARASKSAVGSSGGAAGSLGGGSFGSIGEVAEALSNPNLSVDDAAKFGLSQYNLIDPNPSRMTFRNLEMAKYMPGLIQGAMNGNLKGAVGGAVGGMAGGLIGDSLGSGVVSQLAQGAASGGVSSAISGGNPLGGAMNGVKGAGLGIAKDTVLGAMNNVIPSPNIGTGLRNAVDSTNCFTTGGCIKSPSEFANNLKHNTLNSLSNGGYDEVESRNKAAGDQIPVREDLATWAKANRQMIEKVGTTEQRKILSQVDKNANSTPVQPSEFTGKSVQSPSLDKLVQRNQPSPVQPSEFTGKSVQSPSLDKLVQRNQPSPVQPSEFTGKSVQSPSLDKLVQRNQPSPVQPSGFTGKSVQSPSLDKLVQRNQPSPVQPSEFTGKSVQSPGLDKLIQGNKPSPAQSSVPETMQPINRSRTLNHSPDNIQYRNSVGITPAPNNRATEFTSNEETGTAMPR